MEKNLKNNIYIKLNHFAVHLKQTQHCKSTILQLKKEKKGTSLVVQWLRLRIPNSGGPGSIPGQGTRACMLQLKDPTCHN